MRKTITLAVAISSVLLGAVAAEPDPAADTSNTKVGSEKSNVDEHSSSGSYYPYSAGTVGDDPADPKSTSVSPDAHDDPTGPTDQWGDIDSDGDGYVSPAELDKAAPALSASFSAMDVDDDEKLTRGEFRTWHESYKAKRGADQEANASSGTNDRAR
jgi:hypothetical protein